MELTYDFFDRESTSVSHFSSNIIETFSEKSLFPFEAQAHRPFGSLEDTLKWCRSNIAGEWRWNVETWDDNQGATYNFYFMDEFDCLTFTMRWS
jgi:hypothetical protein